MMRLRYRKFYDSGYDCDHAQPSNNDGQDVDGPVHHTHRLAGCGIPVVSLLFVLTPLPIALILRSLYVTAGGRGQIVDMLPHCSRCLYLPSGTAHGSARIACSLEIARMVAKQNLHILPHYSALEPQRRCEDRCWPCVARKQLRKTAGKAAICIISKR